MDIKSVTENKRVEVSHPSYVYRWPAMCQTNSLIGAGV